MNAAVVLFASATIIKSIVVVGPITGSQDTAGQVEIETPSPIANVTISLQSNNPGVAQVPLTAPSPKGSVSTFPVKTFPVKTPTDVTITAQIGASSKSTVLRVLPPNLSVLGCEIPPNVNPQKQLKCTAWLDGLAPEATTVTLASSLPAAIIPATVTIPRGANKEAFQVRAEAIAQSATVQLSASYAGVTKSTSVTVMPVALENVSFAADHVVGGNDIPLNIKLTAPPPTSGLVIKFSTQVVAGDFNPLNLFASFNDKDELHTLPVPTRGVSTAVTLRVVTSTDFAPNDSRTVMLRIDPAAMQILTIEPDHFSHVPLGGQQAKVVLGLNGSYGPSDTVTTQYGGDTQITEATHPYFSYTNAAVWTVNIAPCSVQATCTVWVKARYHGVERKVTATVAQ